MKKILVMMLSATVIFVACSKGVDIKTEDKGFVNDDYFISVEQLNEKIGQKNLILVDARENSDYNKGHIKGAINVTWQQLSDVSVNTDEEGFGVVLAKDKLQTVLQDLGFNNDSEIVIYSNADDGWGEDARLLWTLKLNGVDNVRILDGSYKYYESKNYKTTKDPLTLKKGTIELSNLDNDIVIDTKQLENIVDSNSVRIVDTRSKSEYDGAKKYGESKGGHIPNSVNIPLNKMFTKYGTVIDKEEFDDIMSQANISKDDEIITYCTAGIRSSFMFVMLKTYGYENVKNYDESYYRWSSLNDVE